MPTNPLSASAKKRKAYYHYAGKETKAKNVAKKKTKKSPKKTKKSTRKPRAKQTA
jgi:hypothetical protein